MPATWNLLTERLMFSHLAWQRTTSGASLSEMVRVRGYPNGSAFWGEIAGETQERKPPFRQNIGYEESCSLILTATPRFIRVLMEATFRQFTRSEHRSIRFDESFSGFRNCRMAAT